MITSTAGTNASVSPAGCARRSRNASLKRASVNALAISTTIQNTGPRRAICLRDNGERTGGRSAGRGRSRTKSAITANDRNAGITANQNTSVKLSASAPSGRWRRAARGRRRWCRAIGVTRSLHRADRPAQVGYQRVARRTTNALADAVDEACREQPSNGRSERKDRLGEGGKPIAEGGEPFTVAESVTERAGENPHDQCGRFRNAFDDSDRERRGAESDHEIQRQ